MDQKPIRNWNSNEYTAEEGAAIITELHNRTAHDEDGYNSISELASKVQILEGGSGSIAQGDNVSNKIVQDGNGNDHMMVSGTFIGTDSSLLSHYSANSISREL